jgi:hypothetical protein
MAMLWSKVKQPLTAKDIYNNSSVAGASVKDALNTLSIASGEMEVSLDYYEGANPPAMINLDNYNFDDAAGFNHGSNEDIIFRINPAKWLDDGFKLSMRYCMNTADLGNVRFKLNARIKVSGDPIGAGTDYEDYYTLNPMDLADTLGTTGILIVPAARIPDNAEMIEYRLTRMGSDPLDTHLGMFCLADIKLSVL